MQLWDLQQLLNGPPLVHDARLLEPDSDDDDDEMDVDMEPSSSKGISELCFILKHVFHDITLLSPALFLTVPLLFSLG